MHQSTGVLATVISTALLLFGASTDFAELKAALNTIWGVVVKPGRPFFTLLRDRFFSFSIVLAWIYYSACILFFGAEITKGYAREFGSGILPNSRAVLIDDLLRERLKVSTATIVAASKPPGTPPPQEQPSND